jgi:hypothetical protein
VFGVMNFHSMRDFRDASAETDLTEDRKMDQIRDLICGDMRRQHEARIAALELRVRELEVGIYRRLDAMQARIDQLSGEKVGHFDELARSLADLSDRVRKIPRE